MRRYTIGIDAGHPSYSGDRGVVTSDFVESDYTISMAHLVARWIRNSYEPFDLAITRSRIDEVLSLRRRGDLTKGCDLAISLHVNAGPKPTWHGGMAFTRPDEDLSIIGIGDLIMDAWPRELVNPKHSTCHIADEQYPQVFNALEHYKCPGLLIEMGYATNASNLAALQRPSIQSAMAAAIMVGLVRFRHIMEDRNDKT
jgi:N-acetylmuramoyl-L-alanine amidase